MIVINSISNDGTTTEVIKWIKYLSNKRILRINSDFSDLSFIHFDSEKHEFLVRKNNKIYNLYDTEAFWYRKGGVLYRNEVSNTINNHNGLEREFKTKITNEIVSLSNFTKSFLKERALISLGGDGSKSNLNKLHILELAKKHELNTPKTLISNNLNQVQEKVISKGDLITKAISDGIYIFKEDFSYYSYTELINKNELQKISQNFFPSLFQLKINKKYEVRTFFLKNRFFSMAIFSQNNAKTEIDFRKYDNEKPNRTIPYKLPKEIEQKLSNLFLEIGLDTGSVDLIVDEHNNYIFLEINPVGQFSMVSYPCNYYLELEVAKYLTKDLH